MNRSLHLRALGVAALLIFTLAGCDGDEDPAEADTSAPMPTTATTVTSTPTVEPMLTSPVEPTMPAAALEPSKAGAEAFVTYYWSVVNYATKTGEVKLLEELDQPACDTCQAGIDGIAKIYSRGGRIVGGDYSVTMLESVESASGRWTVVAHTWIDEQRAIQAGSLNHTYPAGRDKWLMALARVDDSWSVSTLESV
ncbi:hypothetical protein F0U44_12285 [Nocardioides humilatus]|uniref:DUF6318 domain-containing protein n=1 Tax=Nocardioides humilatus TaxID=2607660 RepID=A0A5B1LER1_9ACTN|nr:DUF6318 family protein [Nocardioides humilatus]KAA1419221.1 hypothetical protein F0U44_12285 [Nocardioides humilatus]